ncbi:MAG: SPOR domain-containing protein [Oceanococcus sp.]|nr:MAG: SPOR domain-containing protein [Oceanococcus sp.]
MDELVKQRLVGAVVLALIAVVLIPWMFGSPKDPRMTIQPSFAGTPVPNVANQRNEVVLLEPQSTSVPRSEPEPTPRRFLSEPAPRAMPSPQATPSAAPAATASQSWLLQLASYSNRAAADDFRSRLSKDGYVSYREQVKVGAKTYYRVRLKVNGSKAQAEAVKTRIEKKYRLQAKLLPAR